MKRRGMAGVVGIGQWWKRKRDDRFFYVTQVHRHDRVVQALEYSANAPPQRCQINFTALERDYAQMGGAPDE